MATKGQEATNPRALIAALAASMGLEVPENYVAEVVRKGDKIILPEGASIPEVIEALTKEYESERQKVSVNTTVNVPPWDGAIALQHAITEELGLVLAKEIPGSWFSPEQPPQEMEVEYDLGKTMTVRWGRFELPGMSGAIAETGITRLDSGEFAFTCKITTVRKWQARARKILDNMRAFAMVNSIHKGKAFSIQFLDNDGDVIAIPTPKFFKFAESAPIFRRDFEQAVDRNIFTPIRHADDLKRMGESLKRGILFAGQYGVGKTMLASHIAQYAVSHGWTFIYVKNSAELPMALRYAAKYQPAVVFAEDVDRIAGIERSDEVNNLLNQLDGVDSKSAQLMTLLTSNHSDKVNAAMRRPGRIDLILQVLPPDEDTIERMVKAFVATGLDPQAELKGISEELQGLAPAYVREACSRARLEALRRTGNPESKVNGDDLTAVAKEVRNEKEFFAVKEPLDTSDVVRSLADGLTGAGTVIQAVLDKAAAKQ